MQEEKHVWPERYPRDNERGETIPNARLIGAGRWVRQTRGKRETCNGRGDGRMGSKTVVLCIDVWVYGTERVDEDVDPKLAQEGTD